MRFATSIDRERNVEGINLAYIGERNISEQYVSEYRGKFTLEFILICNPVETDPERERYTVKKIVYNTPISKTSEWNNKACDMKDIVHTSSNWRKF